VLGRFLIRLGTVVVLALVIGSLLSRLAGAIDSDVLPPAGATVPGMTITPIPLTGPGVAVLEKSWLGSGNVGRNIIAAHGGRPCEPADGNAINQRIEIGPDAHRTY
jgi:hypothetical protein